MDASFSGPQLIHTLPHLTAVTQDMSNRQYEVDCILDCRYVCNEDGVWQMQYIVKWVGYGPDECEGEEGTWEPRRCLLPHAAEILYSFEVLASCSSIIVCSYVNENTMR